MPMMGRQTEMFINRRLEEMATSKGRAWKLERASVSEQEKSRPRSNKYSDSDSSRKLQSGSRERVWVGGYDRQDGTHVEGYYRSIGNH
jgi:hypothetical protein